MRRITLILLVLLLGGCASQQIRNYCGTVTVSRTIVGQPSEVVKVYTDCQLKSYDTIIKVCDWHGNDLATYTKPGYDASFEANWGK